MSDNTGQTPHPQEPAEGGDSGQHPEEEAPLGGDKTTEDQLDADGGVEEDTLKTLDPNDSPA